MPLRGSSIFSFLCWLCLYGTALDRRPDETEHGDDHSGECQRVTYERDGAGSHAMRIGPEVVTDVDHGSKNRKPETRTHERRKLDEDSAGQG